MVMGRLNMERDTCFLFPIHANHKLIGAIGFNVKATQLHDLRMIDTRGQLFRGNQSLYRDGQKVSPRIVEELELDAERSAPVSWLGLELQHNAHLILPRRQLCSIDRVEDAHDIQFAICGDASKICQYRNGDSHRCISRPSRWSYGHCIILHGLCQSPCEGSCPQDRTPPTRIPAFLCSTPNICAAEADDATIC